MKATIEGAELRIDIYHLLASMSSEHLALLADSLSIQGAVIRYVVQQILDGWTEHDSRGGLSCVAGSEPYEGLDWAVRQVARRAGDVATSEIKRLEQALRSREEENTMLRRQFDERRFTR